jgi:flagellar M-ring protein FliF
VNLQAIFKELTPRARIGLGAAVLGVVLVSFFLLKLATAPSYATIMTDVDPAKADSITTALAERGVSYELTDGGTGVAVEKSQISEARIALANAGVNAGSGDQPGFELLDEQKLGSSDFQQRVTYQRALEGEIAKTIAQIDGVNGAEVQLTLPEDKLFSSESRPATAAVLLSGGSGLDGNAVRGIAGLVSSSVSGLRSDKVTITDGNGQMLWPNGDGTGGSSAKLAAQGKYAAQVESDVNDMLNRTLGPNKARVEVSANLNMDESSKEELAYADKGTALETDKATETLKGSGGGGGTAGTEANIEGTNAAAAGAGSDYSNKTEKSTFGVGKTVTKTKVAPGSVEKMQVAILKDSKVQLTDTDLKAMVAGSAGVDTARGDTMTVTTVPFAPIANPKAPLPITPTGVLGMLKYVLAGLAALVFLFLASKSLRRREAADLSEPKWLSEIEAPRPLSELVAALEAGNTAGEGAGALGSGEQGALGSGSSQEQLAAVAAQDPERLARQLRQWMTEGEKTPS